MIGAFEDLLAEPARRRRVDPGTTDPEAFFTGLLAKSETLVRDDPELRACLARIAADIGADPEGLVESVARRSHVAIDKAGSGFDTALGLVRAKADFERRILRDALPSLDLTPGERVLLGAGLAVAPQVDSLFFRWKAATGDVAGRTGRRLGLEKAEVVRRLAARGLDHPYSVIVDARTGEVPETYEEEGEYRQVAYAAFFPDESAEIARILREAADAVGDETQARYLRAFALATGEEDLDRAEERWAAVDLAWIETSGRVLLVHPMEAGYADPIRVMPEVRAIFRSGLGAREIDSVKRAMLDWEEREFGEHPRYPEFRRALENLQAGVFLTPVYSGEDFDFRMSGQIVPNRGAVRIRGTKVLVDRSSVESAVESGRELAGKAFAPGFVEAWDRLVAAETFLLYVVAHECGHSVLMSATTREEMGSHYRNVEEFKASHLGLTVLRGMEGLPEGMLDSILLFLAVRIVRSVSKGMRTDRTLEPYHREALYMLNAMLDAGLVAWGEDGVSVRLEDRDRIFDAWLALNRDLVAIYLDGRWEDAGRFAAEHGRAGGRTAELFEYLDRRLA